MEGILNILQTVSTNDKFLPLFVEAYEEHQSVQLKGISSNDALIQHITSLMSKPATRFQGFYTLTNVFQQIPLDVLEQKGQLWATLAVKICAQKGADDVVAFAFRLIRFLAHKSVEIPELSKSFVSNTIGKLCETLNEASAAGHLEALKCVETLLSLYPGPCSPLRGAFEKFIVKFVDSTDQVLVEQCGKCFHLLQQIRGGGVEGISQKMAWQFYQTKLIGSLHKALDAMYANVTELYDEPIEKSQLKIAALELSTEPVERAVQLITRSKNLIAFLAIALKEPFPVSKPIEPKKILNLISRALAVNSTIMGRNTISDNLAIGALLPSFHIAVFKLVDSLILTLKTYLVPYYKEILGFVYDGLKWTCSNKSPGQTRPYVNLRIAAYNTLSLWCSTLKFGSCVELISQGIVEQIEFDITPFQNEFTLQVLSGSKKHMSKKARRQLHKVQNDQSKLAMNHSKNSDSQKTKVLFSDEGNQALCCAALRCLKTLVVSSSCFLKPTILKDIHNKIIALSLLAPGDSSSADKLYSNFTCRLRLYEVLECLVLSPNNLCPPPTQLAIQIVSRAQIFDIHPIVRESCFNLMKNLEKVIHPQKESLLFPTELREIKNAFAKFGRTLTEVKPGQSFLMEEDDDEEEVQEESEDEVLQVQEIENEVQEVVEQPAEAEKDKEELIEEIHVESDGSEASQPRSPCFTIDLTQETKGPESPHFVLQVEDDDSDVEMVETNGDAYLGGPPAKRSREGDLATLTNEVSTTSNGGSAPVENAEETAEDNEPLADFVQKTVPDYVQEFQKKDQEDVLLADIADKDPTLIEDITELTAAFVDELE